MKIKILELFAGIGACSKALKNIGIDVEIVDAVEIDKYAIESFNAIHNTNFEPQDITKWDKDIEVDLITHGSPCTNFSVAGKQEGGDKGSGTQSSLMYESIRIIEKLKPKYVLWENVKNLLSKKHRHNFDDYIEIMNNLGYNSYYQVLNAKDYGIPQNRERVYTISIRKDLDKGYIFPEKEELKLKLKDMLEDKVDEKYFLSDKMVNFFYKNEQLQKEKGNGFRFNVTDGNVIAKAITTRAGSRMDDNFLKCIHIGDIDMKGHDSIKRVYSIEGLSPTLTNMQGGNRQPKVLEHQINKVEIPQMVKVRKYAVDTEKLTKTLRSAKIDADITNREIADKLNIPLTKVEHYFRKDNSFAIPDAQIWLQLKEVLNIETDEFDKSIMTFEGKEGVYEKANRHYLDNGIAPTLTQQQENVITNLRIRKLTPLECWRLMGFDDEDFYKAEKVNSNTQLYKEAGNSIVVKVLEKIFTNLFYGSKNS